MALNKILKEFVNELKRKFAIEGDESKLYEHLVNYVLISKYQSDAFCDKGDLEHIVVDRGNLFGIDSIAFIVNNNLVISKTDIDIYAKSKSLDINIIFNQVTIEDHVDSGKLLKAFAAVRDFVGKRSLFKKQKSEQLENSFDIYDTLFSYAKLFDQNTPKVTVNFVTASKSWSKEEIEALINEEKENFTNNYSEIKQFDVNILGSDHIIEGYKDIENSYDIDIKFNNNLPLDGIDKVEQAYIGYLPGTEYLKIITDKNNKIRPQVFYENVRAYQGRNQVNREISETLKNPLLQDKFILLNNGVTIVTKSWRHITGNMYSLKEFQVVNGCQTSYEIYFARNHADKILVPIKIIHATNSEVISMIIKSTNRQTPIPAEAFVALETYHKRLQLFFEACSKQMPLKIFYERRLGEMQLDSTCKRKSGIITLHSLVRNATSVLFQEPYIDYNNNPANILRNRYEKMFQVDHPYEIYYLSCYLFVFLQNNLNLTGIEYKFRFYIIMVACCLIMNGRKYTHFDRDTVRKIKERLNDVQESRINLTDIMIKAKDMVISFYRKNNQNSKNVYNVLRSSKYNSDLLNYVDEELSR